MDWAAHHGRAGRAWFGARGLWSWCPATADALGRHGLSGEVSLHPRGATIHHQMVPKTDTVIEFAIHLHYSRMLILGGGSTKL